MVPRLYNIKWRKTSTFNTQFIFEPIIYRNLMDCDKATGLYWSWKHTDWSL